jgi:hypothetical protein
MEVSSIWLFVRLRWWVLPGLAFGGLDWLLVDFHDPAHDLVSFIALHLALDIPGSDQLLDPGANGELPIRRVVDHIADVDCPVIWAAEQIGQNPLCLVREFGIRERPLIHHHKRVFGAFNHTKDGLGLFCHGCGSLFKKPTGGLVVSAFCEP